jgi:membrane protein required for colicin V production
MAVVDWLLFGVLLASMLVGAWRGLVFEVLSLAGWLAAFVVAQVLAPQVAAWLPMGNASVALRYAAAFALVFVLTVFAAGLMAWLVKKVVEAVGLRPIDRVLGAVFGLLRGLVLLLAVTVVVGMTPMAQASAWQESAGAPILQSLLRAVKPLLPETFGKYLP